MTQIDLMIAGAQKAGTTSLVTYLSSHPAFFGMPTDGTASMEFPYFVADEWYRDGFDAAYRAFFSKRPDDGQVVTVKSVGVMFVPKAIDRLHEHNPHCRVIAILRDPVDRANSAYWYLRRLGQEPADTFEAALDLEAQRLADDFEHNHHFAYVGRGRYAEQLRRLHERFGAEQVLPILFDDLVAGPGRIATTIAEWLDVDASFDLDDGLPQINEGGVPRSTTLARAMYKPDSLVRTLSRKAPPSVRRALKQVRQRASSANETPTQTPPMTEQVRARLSAELAPANRELEALLGRDLSAWT